MHVLLILIDFANKSEILTIECHWECSHAFFCCQIAGTPCKIGGNLLNLSAVSQFRSNCEIHDLLAFLIRSGIIQTFWKLVAKLPPFDKHRVSKSTVYDRLLKVHTLYFLLWKNQSLCKLEHFLSKEKYPASFFNGNGSEMENNP